MAIVASMKCDEFAKEVYGGVFICRLSANMVCQAISQVRFHAPNQLLDHIYLPTDLPIYLYTRPDVLLGRKLFVRVRVYRPDTQHSPDRASEWTVVPWQATVIRVILASRRTVAARSTVSQWRKRRMLF